MEITSAQKEQIAAWVGEGLSLSDIQKKITGEMGLSITYMELRFLIDDLEINFPKAAEPAPSEPSASDLKEGDVADANADLLDDDLSGKVSVTRDAVMRPGALVSGQVTFSDGVRAEWQLDQMGRLGLIPAQQGYQPSQEDIQSFQIELQKLLEGAGF